MCKTIQKLIFLFMVIMLIGACSNKKPVESTANQQTEMPDTLYNNETDKLMVGRKIISEKTHLFIRRQQLPAYRTDTGAQRILLIGDSMSKWLRYRIQDYCEMNGHTLSTVTWVSGNTEWFAQYDTLDYYIKKDSITYVFLVLGSNELFVKDFAKNRARNVDKIAERLANLKWIWVGPPNWRKDKGINDCLIEKLGRKKFFLSKDLKYKRQKDGMHPSVASCSMWVDSIVSWISNQSTSRIKLNVPDSSFHLKPDALVLKPLL